MTEKDWKDKIFNKVIHPDKTCSYEMIYEALNLAEKHFKKERFDLYRAIDEHTEEISRLKAENDRLVKQIPGTGENLTSVQLRHQVDKLKAENEELKKEASG